jgi:transposase
MNARELAEELWPVMQPLLPPEPPKPKGGRPRIPDRKVLAGIIFMLLSSCSWANLPAKQLGCGSPVTCWRRVRDWQQAGVWDRLHQVLLAELRHAGQVDFSRCSLDSVSVRAKHGGELTGANPVDRGKRGSKYHLLVERGGVPLAAAVSAANTPDAALLEPVVDAVPAVKGRRGRPRRRPGKLHTDKAYDSTASRLAGVAHGLDPGRRQAVVGAGTGGLAAGAHEEGEEALDLAERAFVGSAEGATRPHTASPTRTLVRSTIAGSGDRRYGGRLVCQTPRSRTTRH